MTDRKRDPEDGASHNEDNSETRKPPGNTQTHGAETTGPAMYDLVQSMERLTRLAEDNPIAFRELVDGNTDHVDAQLVHDMDLVREQISKKSEATNAH